MWLTSHQAARKKLESRRLAYDASLAKMQKAKKEDFRVEEELRSQKAKYEETSEDVYRRMQDIKEAEVDSIADLTAFLDAELGYYDRCRELLVSLKREWPAVYVRRELQSEHATYDDLGRLFPTAEMAGNSHVPVLTLPTPTLRGTAQLTKSPRRHPRSAQQYARTVPFLQTTLLSHLGRSLKSMTMERLDPDSTDLRLSRAQLSFTGTRRLCQHSV